MPLVDVAGNGEIEAPEQYGPTAEKVGTMLGLMVIVSVVVVAQSPAVGVKVYVVVAVLFKAGLHVPVMPLLDVVGNAGMKAPEQ